MNMLKMYPKLCKDTKRYLSMHAPSNDLAKILLMSINEVILILTKADCDNTACKICHDINKLRKYRDGL